QIYDAASNILVQTLSQISGVGQVSVSGSSSPAVRIELNPRALAQYGIGLADVRTAITNSNSNRPKGVVERSDRRWQIYSNDQM
ncbi:efflux RND transporter permease subunit, partial [Acinetobacter baumannii]